MSAEGRAKLWAREKIEQLSPKPRPERKPFHGVRTAREILCQPAHEEMNKFPHSSRDMIHQSERELYFDAAAEREARRRHRDSTDALSETHAVASGDDPGEDGLT